VHIHGKVSEAEKVRLYQEAWVACLPSFKEGFGLSVPEAALCDTPSVGYDVPGVCDAIHHDKTGLLVPYGDAEALYNALNSVLSDGNLRDRLIDGGNHLYADFSWEAATQRMEDALLDILGGSSDQLNDG